MSSAKPSTTPEESLTYPISRPEIGSFVPICEGVWWIRLPLPFRLDHINVWALEDGDGWALVDTGIRTEETVVAWERLIGLAPFDRPLRRIIVTHMHPDHIGMAGGLTRKFGCRLWITRLEFLTCRSLAADTGREAPDDAVGFYRAAGWDAEAIETYRARFGFFGASLHALPDSFHRLRDGDEILIGGRSWRVVVGSGHSPEHACLWCPELKLFISGDQVLPKITSNVSVFPTEPDGDPLDDWLTSLAKVKGIVPNDVLVLPAHNDPFYGLHERLDDLISFHEQALQRLEKLIAEKKRAVDVFGVLFKRKINEQVLSMATGESLAHLNCLMRRGVAVRERDGAGVDWYRAARTEEAPQ